MLRSLFRAAKSPSGSARLHLGCGTTIRPGWVNLDRAKLPGVEVFADVLGGAPTPLPFQDDSIEEFFASHVLEHVHDTLALMQELHRIAKPGATAVFRVPYGSSDDADEDPTHVRRFFVKSFSYFCRLGYTHADYGYTGDWDTESIVLTVDERRHAGKSFDQLLEETRARRNVVREMIATLRAVKPARMPGSATPPLMKLEFSFVKVNDP
jgi:SAM-dependent methyltransferase